MTEQQDLAFTFLLAITFTSNCFAASAENGLASQCIKKAILGNSSGSCEGSASNSNNCIGLKAAFENSGKQTRCAQKEEGPCSVYAHLQNSEVQWISVASGHLAKFLDCVSIKFHEEDPAISNTGNAHPGLVRAANDPGFLDSLRDYDDGATRFGLRSGDILIRSVQGERLSEIISKSPKGRLAQPQLLSFYAHAADHPITVLDEMDSDDNEGLSPGTARNRFLAAMNEATTNRQEINLKKNKESDLKSLMIAAATKQSRETSSAKVNNKFYQKKYFDRTYSLGLDLSLFDRVASTYHKHIPDFFSAAEYDRAPKDVSDELSLWKGSKL